MSEKFESWAIIELFGHSQIAGLVSEQTIGGQSFIRVDVPEIESTPAFTRFLGNGAIYSLTPVSEDIARLAIRRIQPQPIRVYMPELYLPEPTTVGDDLLEREEGEEEALDF